MRVISESYTGDLKKPLKSKAMQQSALRDFVLLQSLQEKDLPFLHIVQDLSDATGESWRWISAEQRKDKRGGRLCQHSIRKVLAENSHSWCSGIENAL